MLIEDQDYLKIMRENDTKEGMNGSYLQRTCKALEIIAQNIIDIRKIIKESKK